MFQNRRIQQATTSSIYNYQLLMNTPSGEDPLFKIMDIIYDNHGGQYDIIYEIYNDDNGAQSNTIEIKSFGPFEVVPEDANGIWMHVKSLKINGIYEHIYVLMSITQQDIRQKKLDYILDNY